MHDQPWRVLTRHFFHAMFDFGFLSDAGSESFKRLLMGAAAVSLGLGLAMVRAYISKYANLADAPVDRYVRVVTADHALLIALSMWIVATAVALAGHALFPDETDYRVLMKEPISRTTIFGAKLAALMLFAALFVTGAQASLFPLFLLTLVGPNGLGAVVPYTLAYLFSSLAGSAFAALAIVALHGLIVLLLPRHLVTKVAIVARSLLIGALVMSLPLVLRLPASARAFAEHNWWLPWAPPAWFVGLERWLLGDAHRAGLALQAVAGLGAALVVAVASYAILYRHFDRVTLRPMASHAPRRRRWFERTREASHPIRLAVRTFAWITLRRSVLHQGIVVVLAATAGGLVVNSFINNDMAAWLRQGTDPGGAMLGSLLWVPFPLMIVACAAVRLALGVPIELRANWIFRTTDDQGIRPDAIGAAVQTVFVAGVLAPIGLIAPLQALLFGGYVLLIVAIETVIGWLFVEWLMSGYRVIPFTCSYIPGKGFVPQMVVKGLLAFTLFTGLSAGLLRASLLVPAMVPVVVAVLGGAALVLLIRRRRNAPLVSPMFEDELPSEVNPLRLNVD